MAVEWAQGKQAGVHGKFMAGTALDPLTNETYWRDDASEEMVR